MNRTAIRDYAARVREFSPNARLFLAAAALGGLSSGVSGVLLNLYIVSLGYDMAFLGRLLSFGPVGAILGALLAAPVVYFWNTRRAMLLGIALAGAGAVTLLTSADPTALRTGIALTAMGSILFYTAVPPFLTRHSTPRERTHLFGVVVAAYVVSAALGALVAGFLYRLMSQFAVSPSEAYRLALFVGALLTATGIPLIALVREDRAPDIRRDDPDAPGGFSSAAGASEAGTPPAGFIQRTAGRLNALRKDLLDPTFVRLLTQFVFADILIRAGGNLVLPLMNVHFVGTLGASEEVYGALRFWERALVVGATLLVAPLSLKLGPVATVALTQVLSIPLLLAVGFAPTLGLASLAYLMRGPLMEMTVPTRDAFLMESVPERARTSANAIMQLAGYAVAFVALRLSGRLIEAWGFGLVC
ncbi:MAG TPA: MFS transporter, partial [Chloroflexota bacterium]|nr:MFS transporter [Chloroflexota bacterium]